MHIYNVRSEKHHWVMSFAILVLFSMTYRIANAQVELRTIDSNTGNLTTTLPVNPTNRQPVLFVHGHDNDSVGNWLNPLHGLTSIGAALSANNLGIEPYFIDFQDHNRSIVADAIEIGQAVDSILNRHNANYDANNPDTITQQLVIIAYSKGTISTRLYLKSLDPDQHPLPDVLGRLDESATTLPAHDDNFRPISEFIAIAPPNHGLTAFDSYVSGSLSLMQLNNGYTRDCGLYDDDATDFIKELNGHLMADTHASAVPLVNYDSEAPRSRSSSSPQDTGVLYVTIYASSNEDIFVGGDIPPGAPGNTGTLLLPIEPDCTYVDSTDSANSVQQGRKVAKNLATHAITTTVTIPRDPANLVRLHVHENTVHTCAVIYRALYTAAHHHTPSSLNEACRDDSGVPVASSVPEIPSPPQVCQICFIDFCIHCYTGGVLALLLALLTISAVWYWRKHFLKIN